MKEGDWLRMPDNVRNHNRAAWDKCVADKNPWTIPVSPADIDRARRGDLQLLLTPSRPVPRDWYPPLADLPVLCLASGGGQQGPMLAAAGAKVTVLDNSPRQLAQDRLVAEREGLRIELIEGDAADMAMLADSSFGLIFHPCSNCFMPDIRPVWRECFRVLRPGGVLLAGFTNPVRYLFDADQIDAGRLEVRWPIPYSDVDAVANDEKRRAFLAQSEPYEFGHTLADQIAGQLDAGFLITGFFEDRYPEPIGDPLSRFIDSFIATRAVKA